MPEFGLINMNGRLYDPVLNRMLSTDNEVPGVFSTQGYNRYAYALNNPLLYNDPDGELPILVAALIGAAISATTYTAQVAFSNGGFRNWDWGQFALNTSLGLFTGAVSGGVANYVGSALSAAKIGGFAGGAILGASTGLSSSVVNGIVKNDFSFKSIATGTLAGALIGGILGGLSASRDGRYFWTGEEQQLMETINMPMKSVQQVGEYDCGYACMESIDAQYGGTRTQAGFKQIMGGANKGVNTAELIKKAGYKSYGVYGPSGNEIAATMKGKVPVILAKTTEEAGIRHAVIPTKMEIWTRGVGDKLRYIYKVWGMNPAQRSIDFIGSGRNPFSNMYGFIVRR
jgi:RHS repeat-associated protein